MSRVAYILDNVPATRTNYLLLLLTYWQVFDGINIPQEIVRQIAGRATQPETVNRSRRKVLERLRIIQRIRLLQQIEEDEDGEGENHS